MNKLEKEINKFPKYEEKAINKFWKEIIKKGAKPNGINKEQIKWLENNDILKPDLANNHQYEDYDFFTPILENIKSDKNTPFQSNLIEKYDSYWEEIVDAYELHDYSERELEARYWEHSIRDMIDYGMEECLYDFKDWWSPENIHELFEDWKEFLENHEIDEKYYRPFTMGYEEGDWDIDMVEDYHKEYPKDKKATKEHINEIAGVKTFWPADFDFFDECGFFYDPTNWFEDPNLFDAYPTINNFLKEFEGVEIPHSSWAGIEYYEENTFLLMSELMSLDFNQLCAYEFAAKADLGEDIYKDFSEKLGLEYSQPKVTKTKSMKM